jgi:hypothetical protein
MMVLSAIGIAVAEASMAQEPGNLAPATRIRVSAASRQLKDVIGVVVAHRGDSLFFQPEHRGDTLALHVYELTRLDVSVERKSHGWAGAGIGLVAGAALGAIAGEAAGDDPPQPCDDVGCLFVIRMTANEKAAMGAIGLGLVGTIAGGIVGHFHRTDRWESVVVPRPKIATISGRRVPRLDVGVSIRLF